MELRQAWQNPAFRSLRVRHLERVPLGTPYPGVVARVREIVGNDETARNCTLTVDGTGWARQWWICCPAARLGCDIPAVTITDGERPMEIKVRSGAPQSA